MACHWQIALLAFAFVGWTDRANAQTQNLADLLDFTQITNSHSTLRLLKSSDVQTELALSETQKEALRKTAEEQRLARRKLPRVFDLRELDDENRQKQLKASNDIHQAEWQASWTTLDESQRIRLAQIHLQSRGNAALDSPEIVGALQLTDEQQAQFQAVKTAFAEATHGLIPTKDASPAERDRFLKEARRLADKRIADYRAILTVEQAAAFEAMKGKPFAFPQRPAQPIAEVPTGPRPLQPDVFLMTQKEIQKELSFTAEQFQTVATLSQENQRALEARLQNARAVPGGLDARQEGAEAAKYAEALLKVPDEIQLQRLRELTLQKQGPSALRERHVADRLKLTAEQQTQLRRILFEASERNQEQSEQLRLAFQNGNLVKANQLLAEQRQRQAKVDTDSLKVLTDEQKAAFEAMQGKKFTFPDPGARLRQLLGREQKSEST